MKSTRGTGERRGALKQQTLWNLLPLLLLIHKAWSVSGAVLSSLNYDVEVASRLVETTLRATFENKGKDDEDERLQLLLPEEVLLSSFQMEVNGKNYSSSIVRKVREEEKEQEEEGAGGRGENVIYLIRRTARAQRLQIKTRLGPKEKFVVSLGYTYLLRRKRGRYHVVLYLPELKPQDVHLDISVRLMGELRNLTFLKADGKERPLGTVTRGTAEIYLTSAGEIKMKYHRNIDSRTPFTAITHNNPFGNFTPAQGGFRLSFQPQSVPRLYLSDPAFVLSFDVERFPDGGSIQVQSGYFVHFLSPEGLPKLPVHTVFVLDISGSMGELGKLANLKKAMQTTLKSLKREDSFEIFVFSINVKSLGSYTGSPKDITRGISEIMTLRAYGGTNINDALLDSVDGANDHKQEEGIKQIVFLTDGNRTVGELNGSVIRKGVKEANSQRIPIYALAFGNDADMKFLRRISGENGGFARKIRSDGRPAEQLQGFYEEISTPLLTDLDVEYPPDEVKQDSIVRLGQDSYFSGDEVVLAGELLRQSGTVSPKVSADGANGRLQFKVSRKDVLPSPPKPKKGVVERIWAYLSVQDLLSAQELIDDEVLRSELLARALEIALTYNFVTRLTSLVINDHTGKTTGLDGGKGFYPPHMGLPDSVREEIAKGLTLVSPEAFAATLPNELQGSISPSQNRRFSFVDNDPHFVVQVSGLALPLCFDLHGQPGNILSLVRDDVSGLIVNAEVSAAIGRPGATYFTRLFLSIQRLNLTITTDAISVSCFLGDDDNQVSEVWHDTDWTPKTRRRRIRRRKHSGKFSRRFHRRGKRFKRGHSHQRFRHRSCSDCEHLAGYSREESSHLEEPSPGSSSHAYSPVIDAYLEKSRFKEIVPLRHKHVPRRPLEHYRKYVKNFERKGVVNHYLYSYPTNKGNNLLIRSSILAASHKDPPQKTIIQDECNKEFSWEHVTQRRYADVVLIVRGRRKRRRLDVVVSDVNLHVVITNTKNRDGQSFLGFYIQEQKILSPNTTGVIGQFVYKSVGTIGRFPELYSNPQSQENRTIPLAVIHLPQEENSHPRVTRVSAVVSKRRSLLHREKVLCLHVKRHGRGLLAKRSKEYLLPELYS